MNRKFSAHNKTKSVWERRIEWRGKEKHRNSMTQKHEQFVSK